MAIQERKPTNKRESLVSTQKAVAYRLPKTLNLPPKPDRPVVSAGFDMGRVRREFVKTLLITGLILAILAGLKASHLL